ncbi:MAG: M48 family metallopeptidase [Candidatus Nanoarchaeia archaeon]|nr:M48 family metallopeptidase [Candidatus Nanoarchaeia archaeon]MDD5587786.1 M48 family metallopeptidase [Candidatus Nanoarchaeia archaeon]
MERISFYDQIAKNKRNSVILITIIFLVFLLLGYVIGQVWGQGSIFIVMIFSIIISLSYILISYYNSDKIALASVNAKEAPREQFRQFYNSVEGLTLASGLPMPKLYVMQNEQINAFATGRDPAHAVICVTTGALNKLNKQELEGVLAHELSHVANYDIRFMTLTAVLVGMIAIISQMFLRSLWFNSSNSDNKNNNAIFLIIGILLAILAPTFVQLTQLAISRKREYSADASAVKFTRSPTGLIGALEKIKGDKPMKTNKVVSSLFISDPLKKNLDNLMSTHPPLEKRIQILSKM